MRQFQLLAIISAAVIGLVCKSCWAETRQVDILVSEQGHIEFLITEGPETALSAAELSIFQKAEALYPEWFGEPSAFAITEGYIYRFYALLNTYIGIRDETVYVLGGPFGDVITRQGTVADTLAFLINEENIRLSLLSDPIFSDAWTMQLGNLQVEGVGRVTRILTDDINGDAHQRFIVSLRSGQTLLIAHNIDLALRVPDISIGAEVTFFGEYEWSKDGGVMHWTHHDPAGRHVAGWIKYQGKTYQ